MKKSKQNEFDIMFTFNFDLRAKKRTNERKNECDRVEKTEQLFIN